MIVNYSLVLSSNILREFDLRHSLYLHGQRLEWKSNVILRLANDTFSCFPHKFVIYYSLSPLKEKKNQELKLLDFLFFFVIKISSLRLQLNLSVCEKCARLLLFFFFFLILQILSHKDKVYY